jgi:hypothetical protein
MLVLLYIPINSKIITTNGVAAANTAFNILYLLTFPFYYNLSSEYITQYNK